MMSFTGMARECCAWHGDGGNTVLQSRFGFLALHVARQDDRARETAPIAFADKIVAAFDAPLMFALALDREHIAVEEDLEVLRFHPGDR